MSKRFKPGEDKLTEDTEGHAYKMKSGGAESTEDVEGHKMLAIGDEDDIDDRSHRI